MGPTPLRPSTQADQNASLPMPLGLTTPSPVTTTLRIDRSPRRPPPPSPPRRGAAVGTGARRTDDRAVSFPNITESSSPLMGVGERSRGRGRDTAPTPACFLRRLPVPDHTGYLKSPRHPVLSNPLSLTRLKSKSQQVNSRCCPARAEQPALPAFRGAGYQFTWVTKARLENLPHARTPTISAADRLTGSGKMFARRCSRALIEMDRFDDVPAIDTRRSIVAVASPGHRHPTSIHRREL